MTLPLCLLLSACGGDGSTQVASIPPPPATPAPTPTPTPPAADAFPITRAGIYDLIGRVGPNSHVIQPGEFSMTVSKPSAEQGFVYKLDGPAGFLPGTTTSLEYGPESSSGISPTAASYARTFPYSKDENLLTSIALDVGYSYVSMGEWSWYFVHLDGGTAGDGYGKLVFVSGDRTPQAVIPTSGTATYDARTRSGSVSVPFALTADFGQRTISTRIDQDYAYNAAGDSMDNPTAGIHVGGSAPFSTNGSFDIPLTGTVNYNSGYAINTPQTPPSQPTTGDMNGAFFGPNAAQVGGTFQLNWPNGVPILQDAFVGQQRRP